MRKMCITLFALFIIPAYFFGSEITSTSSASLDYFLGSGNLTKSDVTLYKMSDEKKSEMFKWLAIGSTIACGVGFLTTIPAIGLIAGGYNMYYTGTSSADRYTGYELYQGGSGLLGFSQFLFWGGLGASIAFWILYVHFTKKAGNKTIFEKSKKMSFDIIATPELSGGYVMFRF